MTQDKIDHVLERFDETGPRHQRTMFVALVEKLAKVTAERDWLLRKIHAGLEIGGYVTDQWDATHIVELSVRSNFHVGHFPSDTLPTIEDIRDALTSERKDDSQ